MTPFQAVHDGTGRPSDSLAQAVFSQPAPLYADATSRSPSTALSHPLPPSSAPPVVSTPSSHISPSHPSFSSISTSSISSSSSSANAAAHCASPSSSRCGYLLKIGGKVQTWKRRFFFIRHGQLTYSKKENAAVLGSIALPGSVLHLYQPVNSFNNRPHLWGLTPAPGTADGGNSRLYLFQAASDAERDDWIQVCLECQARLFSPLASASPSAIIQGWLQGSKKGYFVLSASHLSCYKQPPPPSTSSPGGPGPSAEKAWPITAGSALEITPSSAFSFSFQAEGHKTIEVVCTDSVERNHWYRAVHEAVERKVEEKEGQRRQHNEQAERVIEGHISSATSTLQRPPAQHVAQPDGAQWPRGHAESVVITGDEDEDDGQQPQVAAAGMQYKYADSDDEDFSPTPVRLEKEAEEKQLPAPPPSSIRPAAIPLNSELHLPSRTAQPRPPSTPPPPSSLSCDAEPASGDDDDDCYDPLFQAAESQPADLSIMSNPLCTPPDRRRSLRNVKPIVTNRGRGTSRALLSPPVQRDTALDALPQIDPGCPLSPPPATGAGPQSLSGAPPAVTGAVRASSLMPSLLSSSLSVLTSSLQSLLSVAFKGDFAAFRASILHFLEQKAQDAAVSLRSASAVAGSAENASPPASASALSAPPGRMLQPSSERRPKPPAISTVAVPDGVEFQSNPLASSAASARSGAAAGAGSMPTSPLFRHSSSSIPSSPRAPRSHRHPRLLHLHLLEAIDLPPFPSSTPPDCRVEVVTRGFTRKEAAAGADEEDDARLKARKGAKVKTKTCSATRSPLWDEYVTLACEEWVEELVLDLVHPESITADIPLGRVVVSIVELEAADGRMTGWFPVCNRTTAQPTQGLIYLSIALDEHYLKDAERTSDAFIEHRRAALHLPPLTPHVYPTRLFLCTWNVGNAAPPLDLSALLPLHLAEVYVVCTQECRYEARNDLKSCRMDWLCALLRHFGNAYTLVKYSCLWDIRSAVFVLNRLAKAVTNVTAQTVATGIGNMLGNKGGVCVSLTVHHTQLAFLNLHLAAHQENTPLRDQNVKTIVKALRLATGCGGGGGGAGAGDVCNAFHHLFLLGDLNYRLEYGTQGDSKSPSLEQFSEMSGMVDEAMQGNASLLTDLLVTDQLRHEMQDGRALPASLGWKEGEPAFPPTFKVRRQPGTRYVSSRSPAWCDRILWKELKGYAVQQLVLDSVAAIDSSDHKPVVSLFQIDTFLLPAPLDARKGGCSLAILTLSVDELPALRCADTFVSVDSALFPQPLNTPTHRKQSPPQWRDLPARPLQYNNIHRIAHSILSVRLWSAGSGDVIGRTLVSLRQLEQYSNEGLGAVKPGADGASVSLPYGVRVDGGSGGAVGMGMERRSQWVDLQFSVGLSLHGLEVCKLSGMLRFMWRENAERDDSSSAAA